MTPTAATRNAPAHHTAFKPQIDASYEAPEHEATFTLERQLRQWRREISPERYAALMAEWDAPFRQGGQGL